MDGRFLSDTRLHVFTSNDDIIQKGKEVNENVFIWDIRLLRFEKQQVFLEKYSKIYESVNPLLFEFLCFNRWHVYRYAISLWNRMNPSEPINRILTLDLDVVLLVNAQHSVTNYSP